MLIQRVARFHLWLLLKVPYYLSATLLIYLINIWLYIVVVVILIISLVLSRQSTLYKRVKSFLKESIDYFYLIALILIIYKSFQRSQKIIRLLYIGFYHIPYTFFNHLMLAAFSCISISILRLLIILFIQAVYYLIRLSFQL